MITLKHEVEARGFKVVHIKTDSIKIVKPTKELVDFVMAFGEEYGYTFEIEHEFKKFCLVNKAVYIAQNKDGKWEATGAQFQHPYVFKTLFSKEKVIFEDLCEAKSVTSQMYLDFNEQNEDYHYYRFVGKTGLFTPIKPGMGGARLLRKVDDKYYSVTGCKDYRWVESADVASSQEMIDMEYFDKLASEAKEAISKYCNFEEFIA